MMKNKSGSSKHGQKSACKNLIVQNPCARKPGIYKLDGVGVNLERFRPVHSPEEKTTLRKELGFLPEDFILIYTAEFIPRKNHRLLFDILPELKAKIPELKVVLCGKGELLEPYRQLALEHGMDYVTFTGYTKCVADYCRASDVLVMPSHQEGLPLSMIESIATGLPVVASKIRGHVDVVEDCVNGFLFEPSDCSGFVKAVYTLYKNPVLRTEMGMRNVERAKLFSVDTAVSRMANLYRKIMQNTL